MKDSGIITEDFNKSIGVVQVPQNPVLISDSVAAPTEGSRAHVGKRAISYTDADPKRLITGEIIVGSHVYQPPLVDGLKTVGNIAKSLTDGIFNFQQTSYRSWFGLRPQLIIRSSTEFVEIGANRIDDAALAMGYKKLASRVANRVYHYLEAVKLLNCAMYNMATVARFEGDTVLKSFASDLKSSRLNNILANAAKFPVPKGFYDQIRAVCIYLAGVTADGVPVISIPRIDVSVFGNPAVHCNTPSNFQSLDGAGRADPLNTAKGGKARFLTSTFTGDYSPDVELAMNGESELAAFKDLMANIEATVYHFAGNKKRFAVDAARTQKRTNTGKSDAELLTYEVEEAVKFSYDFRGPEALNLTNVSVGGDVNFSAMARLNGGGPLLLDHHVAGYHMEYRFTELLMNQAFEIMRYLEENFHDFSVPGNDWYELVVNDLKLCDEKGIRISRMIADARGMKYGDINEFLDRTKTTAKTPVSTSSIIKYMPIIGATDDYDTVGSVGEKVYSSEFIGNNFCRFDFSTEDPNFTLRNAKRVPRFNPTPFFVHDEWNGVEVYVGNTGPNFQSSDLMSIADNDTPIPVDHALLVNGQRALFDYSRVVQNDPSIARMKFSGIDPDKAKEIADADVNATVYYEDKTQIFVDSLPCVDFSDPLANGFNILFFSGGKYPSVTVRELMNGDNFVARPEQKKVPTKGISNVQTGIPKGLCPLSPSVFQDLFDAAQGGIAATQASPEYMRQERGCVEGFVGAGIMAIPSEVSMLTPSGTYATCEKIVGDNVAAFYNSLVIGNDVSRGITTPLSDAVSEEAGIASFKMAILPTVPCASAKDLLLERNLINSNLPLIDLLKGMAAGNQDSYIMYKYVGSECGRVRLNVEASPIDGLRQSTKGLLPNDLTWETTAVKVRLGQLHNGVDNTGEDNNSMDPVLDGLMDGELSASARSSLTLRQIVAAVPLVDNQAIRYADYPFAAYESDHFHGKNMFLLKMFSDVEVTAVGTARENYLLDVIGAAVKDNYVAPVTGRYAFSANEYVAEVVSKINTRDYSVRRANSSNVNRTGELKTVSFNADRSKSPSGDRSPEDSSSGDRRDSRSPRDGVSLKRKPNNRGKRRRGQSSPNLRREVEVRANHMGKEMSDTIGKASGINGAESASIKEAGARGKASYPTTEVV